MPAASPPASIVASAPTSWPASRWAITTGTQWVSGFDGKATSNTYQVGLYGSFTQDRFYLDGLAGYGYAYNQSWRNILIPGLQPRTAMGQAGANQFFGQLETGYRVDIWRPGGRPT